MSDPFFKPEDFDSLVPDYNLRQMQEYAAEIANKKLGDLHQIELAVDFNTTEYFFYCQKCNKSFLKSEKK